MHPSSHQTPQLQLKLKNQLQIFLLALAAVACTPNTAQQTTQKAAQQTADQELKKPLSNKHVASKPTGDEPSPRDHATPRSTDLTLAETYPPPQGFTRTPSTPQSKWYRSLLVGPIFQPILTFQGDSVSHSGSLIRVGLTGAGQRGPQAALRMRAEFLKSQGKPVVFSDQRGDSVTYEPNTDWNTYLSEVFEQISTKSLWTYDTVAATEPQAGDVFLLFDDAHAVVVLDTCTKGQEKMVLLGEGFVPAQYFHVEHGTEVYWWPWSDTLGVLGFRQPIAASTLRRWKPHAL